jgi:hypothetical protein
MEVSYNEPGKGSLMQRILTEGEGSVRLTSFVLSSSDQQLLILKKYFLNKTSYPKEKDTTSVSALA